MEFDEPVWRLKSLCPVCEQGSSLTFTTCPSCKKVLIICAEEGTVFPDPRKISASETHGSEVCPACEKAPISQFRPSKDTEVRALGFNPSEIR